MEVNSEEKPVHYPTVFARINRRGEKQPFGIKDEDRRSHIYIVGKTGTGKSTLIKTLVLSDINKGKGLALPGWMSILPFSSSSERPKRIIVQGPLISRPSGFTEIVSSMSGEARRPTQGKPLADLLLHLGRHASSRIEQFAWLGLQSYGRSG